MQSSVRLPQKTNKKHVSFDLPTFFNLSSNIFYGEILSAETKPYGQIVYASLVMNDYVFFSPLALHNP